MCNLNFIEQLKYDINKQKKININPKLYIKHRNLIQHNFQKKNISISDLPIETLCGNVFLIKDSIIIEIYSYCDYNYSVYIQINKKQPVWLSKVNVINTAPNLSDTIKFLLCDSEIFYSPIELQIFIINFITEGFQLYKIRL